MNDGYTCLSPDFHLYQNIMHLPNSVTRENYTFMQVMVIYICIINLGSNISQSMWAPTIHKPNSWNHGVVCHKLQFSLGFDVCRRNTELLLFLQQENNVPFQQDACLSTCSLRCSITFLTSIIIGLVLH